MRVPVAAMNDGAIDDGGHLRQAGIDDWDGMLLRKAFDIARRMHRTAIPHANHFMPQFPLDGNPVLGVRGIEIDNADFHVSASYTDDLHEVTLSKPQKVLLHSNR